MAKFGSAESGLSPQEISAAMLLDNEIVTGDIDQPTPTHTFLTDDSAKQLIERYETSKQLIREQDWPNAVAEFIEGMDGSIPSLDHEELAKGLLARLFEKAYQLNRAHHKTTEDFSLRVFGVLSRLDHIPECLTQAKQRSLSKRRPSFFESLEGTMVRYSFIERLPEAFEGLADGIVVGGSVAYGPFFSVRNGGRLHHDPSDVDVLVALKDGSIGEGDIKALLDSDRLGEADRDAFARRFPIFAEMQAAGEADAVSQRFDITDRDFNMSVHFMSLDILKRMNVVQLEQDLEDGRDTIFAVRDYKPKRFEHPVCRQRTFDGSAYEYKVPGQVPVEGGLMATLPGYIVSDNRLYPGLYQNLIAPEFEVFYDETGQTTETVDGFKRIVLGCIRSELAKDRVAKVALAHTRSGIFAPGRYDMRESLAL